MKTTLFGPAVENAEHFVRDHADGFVAANDRRTRYGWIEEFVGLDGAIEIRIVVGLTHRVRGRKSMVEGVMALVRGVDGAVQAMRSCRSSSHSLVAQATTYRGLKETHIAEISTNGAPPECALRWFQQDVYRELQVRSRRTLELRFTRFTRRRDKEQKFD